MEVVIKNITNYLGKNLDLNNNKIEELEYGLYMIYSTSISVLSILTLGHILNICKYITISMIVMFIFRCLSGGAHSNSIHRCALYSTIILNAIGYISVHMLNKINSTCYFFSVGVCLIVLLIYSPADTPEKPIRSSIVKKVLKILSLLFFSVTILIIGVLNINIKIENTVYLTLLWQVFSITPIGYEFYSFFDKLFKGGKQNEV